MLLIEGFLYVCMLILKKKDWILICFLDTGATKETINSTLQTRTKTKKGGTAGSNKTISTT